MVGTRITVEVEDPDDFSNWQEMLSELRIICPALTTELALRYFELNQGTDAPALSSYIELINIQEILDRHLDDYSIQWGNAFIVRSGGNDSSLEFEETI